MPISRSISVFIALNVREIRPIHKPSVRSAPGMRSGPITSNAITQTTTSSGKLISNIRVLFACVCGSRCRDFAFDYALARSRRRFLFLDCGSEAFDRATEVGSEGLQTFRAEQQHDDSEDDQQFSHADAEHFILHMRRRERRIIRACGQSICDLVLAAFSACPETPKRLASSSNT